MRRTNTAGGNIVVNTGTMTTTAGGTLDMVTWGVFNNINSTGRTVWWDYTSGALATDGTNTYRETLPPDHMAFANSAGRQPLSSRWKIAVAYPLKRPHAMSCSKSARA